MKQARNVVEISTGRRVGYGAELTNMAPVLVKTLELLLPKWRLPLA